MWQRFFRTTETLSICPTFPLTMLNRSSIMVSMNRLFTERRAQILGCLVEGMSIRATVRVTGAAQEHRFQAPGRLGEACDDYQDETLRNLNSKRIQCDEVWSFCYAKEKNVPYSTKQSSDTGMCGPGRPLTPIPSSFRPGSSVSGTLLRVHLHDGPKATACQPGTTHHRRTQALSRSSPAAFATGVDYAMRIKLFGSHANEDHAIQSRHLHRDEERPILGTPRVAHHQRPTSSARTSRCGWGCDGSPG